MCVEIAVVLEWEVLDECAAEGLSYKIRFYTGRSYEVTPSSQRAVITTQTNRFTFTAEDVLVAHFIAL